MIANNHRHLPTWISGEWCVAAFRNSLISTLAADRFGSTLAMYFYAVTQSGWNQVRESILRWRDDDDERNVRLFVGTDHGITDPAAIKQIDEDGADARLVLEYHGVYHPKVIWLQGDKRHVVWVGSNNLTRDGLLNNVEFALLIQTQEAPTTLGQWARAIEDASVEVTSDLLRSYEAQRRQFEKGRAQAGVGTFTWEKRIQLPKEPPSPATEPGNLIVEVMPRETGGDGRQLQLPVKAAADFFGISGVGSSRNIELRARGSSSTRSLTMTVFGNNTVRIVISDLEYRDRPCVLVFRKMSEGDYEYEIVAESIFPQRYWTLLNLCTEKTRYGSRRWGVA